MIIDSGLVTGSLQVIGNTTMTGSLSVTGDITGNIKGNADTATSASYALTSSYAHFAATPTVQGVQGTQGIQGIAGDLGGEGIQGIQGLQGVQGTQGTQGIQGLQGADGYIGVDGAQGTQGTQGLQGIAGDLGGQGIQGIQGITGATGIQGATGSTGSQGTAGAQGTTGQTGAQGSTGSQGTTGATGSQGVQGIAGGNGAQGIQGTTGTTGAQGTQGTTGSTGAQGSTGSQGSTGAQGTTGTQGVQGIQGIQGPNAGITSYTNASDNRVITSVNSSTINAEANLTFDGSLLNVTGYIRYGGASAYSNTGLDSNGFYQDVNGTNIYQSTMRLQSNILSGVSSYNGLKFGAAAIGNASEGFTIFTGGYDNNRLTINSSGYVAINGTPSSSYRLDVTGNIRAYGSNLVLDFTGNVGGIQWGVNPYINGVANGGFEIRDNTNGASRLNITSGGSVTATVDMRSPIFYDSNDTAYYVNPASTSNLYDLQLTGAKHTYLYINPGNGNEAMVRYNGGAGSGWYVGKRTSAGINSTSDFHFYSEAAVADVFGITAGGTAVASGDMRAPIFYDSNDTGYYANPASTSLFSTLNGAYIGVANTSQTSGNGISLYNGGGSGQPGYGLMFAGTPTFGTHGSVSGDWATYFTMNDDSSRGWIFRRSGTNVASISGGGILQTSGYMYSSTYVQSGQSMYSPIYYDANDSAYYTDPNSATTSARIAGSVFSDGAFGSNGHSSGGVTSRVFAPKGAAYSYTPGTVAGAIKIRLPNRANDTMWSMKVRIYNYQTNQTAEYLLGNYSYSAGAYNFSATYLGGESSVAQTVRFGNQGGYDCVWIGETSTVWTHPVVSVMDFMGGYSNGSAGNWNNGWEISLVTSFGTVAASQAPNINFNEAYAYSYRGNGNVGGTGAASWHPSGIYCGSTMWQYGAMYKNNSDIHDINIGYANSSLRAPIFYDNNNTGYYVDPASTSNLVGLTVANTISGNISGTAGSLGGIAADRYIFGDGANGRSKDKTSGSANTSDSSNSSGFYFGNSTTGMPSSDWWNWLTVAGNSWGGSDGYRWQMAYSFWGDDVRIRRQQSGSWYAWQSLLHSGNYTSYSPSLTGSGASGTWGIAITGNAARATRANGNFYIDDNYGNTVVGVYSSYRLQGVFAMGDAYKLAADGTSASNHYGIAWSHPNAGGTASNLSSHGMLVQQAGTTMAAISTNIWCSGDVIAYSDARVKDNVEVIDNPLERIKKVRGVTFTRTDLDDKEKRHAGVIAQEMREAMPELVSENAKGELSVSYGNTVSLLIECIKEQQTQIDELKQLVKQLTNK